MYEKEQKKYLYGMLNYFKDNALDPHDKKTIKKINEALNTVLEREIENLNYENTNDVKIKFKKSSGNGSLAEFSWDIDNFKRFSKTRKVNDFENELEDEQESEYKNYFKDLMIEKKPKFTIYKYDLYNYLCSDDVSDRIYACYNLFISIFHEVRHFEQMLLATDKNSDSSKRNLIFAKDNYMLYDQNCNSVYGQNYDKYSIENDANSHAIERCFEIIGEDDYLINCKQIHDSHYNSASFSLFTNNVINWEELGLDESKIDNYDTRALIIHCLCLITKQKHDLSTALINESVKYNTALLEKFPILKKVYYQDENGSWYPKSTAQLMDQMIHEYNDIKNNKDLPDDIRQEKQKDCKEMYYELLYDSLDDNYIAMDKKEFTDILTSESLEKYFVDPIDPIDNANDLNSENNNPVDVNANDLNSEDSNSVDVNSINENDLDLDSYNYIDNESNDEFFTPKTINNIENAIEKFGIKSFTIIVNDMRKYLENELDKSKEMIIKEYESAFHLRNNYKEYNKDRVLSKFEGKNKNEMLQQRDDFLEVIFNYYNDKIDFLNNVIEYCNEKEYSNDKKSETVKQNETVKTDNKSKAVEIDDFER